MGIQIIQTKYSVKWSGCFNDGQKIDIMCQTTHITSSNTVATFPTVHALKVIDH